MKCYRETQIRFQTPLARVFQQNTCCLVLSDSPCQRGRLKRFPVPLMVFI
jgi:hypothetical protein